VHLLLFPLKQKYIQENLSEHAKDLAMGVSPYTPTNGFLKPIILGKKNHFTLLKMISRLFFSEYFQNILSVTHFMNSGFIIPKIKKNVFRKEYSRMVLCLPGF